MRPAIAHSTARARLRPWPGDASIGHLVVLDVTMTPTVEDVDRWTAEAFAPSSNVATVRTSALLPGAAAAFVERGFSEVDRLALLELELTREPRSRLRRTPRTSPAAVVRLRSGDLDAAAAVDASAFDREWAHTAASLDDVARATPRSWRRLAVDRSRPDRADPTGRATPRVATPDRRRNQHVVGFSITGCAGTTGYLQRLAVHPEHRRRGIAAQLVHDAGDWLTRRGATRLFVNTGVDNTPALRLYEALGFARLDDELVVLDRRRDR